MRAFEKALASLENSPPVFKVEPGWYGKTDVRLEVLNEVEYGKYQDNGLLNKEGITSEELDEALAKHHFCEAWDKNTRSYVTNFHSSKESLRGHIVSVMRSLTREYSGTKNPKNTKNYKFVDNQLARLINENDQAREAFYSLFKYVVLNKVLHGTQPKKDCVHVKNSIKILEILRNRYEVN